MLAPRETRPVGAEPVEDQNRLRPSLLDLGPMPCQPIDGSVERLAYPSGHWTRTLRSLAPVRQLVDDDIGIARLELHE